MKGERNVSSHKSSARKSRKATTRKPRPKFTTTEGRLYVDHGLLLRATSPAVDLYRHVEALAEALVMARTTLHDHGLTHIDDLIDPALRAVIGGQDVDATCAAWAGDRK